MFLLILIAAAIWLNGPGVRWLAPRISAHFLGESGFKGSYRLEGTISGGLVIRDLDVTSEGALARLTADRIEPVYQLDRLLRQGEIKALRVDRLHADLRLGIEDDEEKPPLDLDQLAETLRTIHARLIPVEVDLKNLSLSGARDGADVFRMESSSISHAEGSEEIVLSLGEVELEGIEKIPSQEIEISWQRENLTVNRIGVLPGVVFEKIGLSTPADSGPSAEAGIIVRDAVFQLTTSAGLQSLTLDLREGALTTADVSAIAGIEIPAAAKLTSFTLEAADLLPDPSFATAKLRILLEDVAWGDIASPELALDFSVDGESANLSARSVLFGTEVTFEAGGVIDRNPDSFAIGNASGSFSVAEITPELRHFAAKTGALDVAAKFPSASASGTFEVGMERNRPASAKASLEIKPAEPDAVSGLTLAAEWPGADQVLFVLRGDGLELDAAYRKDLTTYQGELSLTDFKSERITPWLEIARFKSAASLNSTARWKGGGDIRNGTHQGKLTLASATVTAPEKADILASGDIGYDWPGNVETPDLRIESGGQILTLNAKMADGLLDLREFLLINGKTDLIKGAGQLPVPADFTKWRDALAKETRAMNLKVDSMELPLVHLKTWLPALEKIDDRSTGRVKVHLTGTFAEPEVDIVLAFKDLRSSQQPKLPPADLELKVAGRDGRLTLDGTATAPDFPAARLTASMGFHPVKWAEEPGLLLNEPVTALIDLPRLEISRFGSLLPQASKIRGIFTGKVDVAGTVGKPEPKGGINLADAGLSFVNDAFPEISGVDMKVEMNLETISLRSLRATIAGGTLAGEGGYTIANKTFDVRLRGDHLPVLRNEMMILRANADLRLQGLVEKAALSGTIGMVDGIFFRDIEILPIGSPFTSPEAASLPKIDAAAVSPTAGIPAPFSDWTLNVALRTEEPFLIRGNLATGRVEGDLKIGGTLGNPAPSGEVVLSRAEASLPFSTLSVREGTLTFSPASGFDPVLEFRGSAEPRPYRVDMYVYGRASDPQMVLTSNPPLPENEIMTLLATGTTTSGLEDPQAASSRALQLLAEEIRRGRLPFSNRLRPILGLLDRVDFSLSEADPYSNDSFSTATLKLHDRWYLSAGMGVEGDTRVLGIWRLRFR